MAGRAPGQWSRPIAADPSGPWRCPSPSWRQAPRCEQSPHLARWRGDIACACVPWAKPMLFHQGFTLSSAPPLDGPKYEFSAAMESEGRSPSARGPLGRGPAAASTEATAISNPKGLSSPMGPGRPAKAPISSWRGRAWGQSLLSEVASGETGLDAILPSALGHGPAGRGRPKRPLAGAWGPVVRPGNAHHGRCSPASRSRPLKRSGCTTPGRPTWGGSRVHQPSHRPRRPRGGRPPPLRIGSEAEAVMGFFGAPTMKLRRRAPARPTVPE
jgi:hypothetical protein